MIDDGKLPLFRGVFMAMVIWMLAQGVEGGRKNNAATPAPTTTTSTTTQSWSSEGNLLCDTDTLTTIKGEWTADSSDCTMENTDSRCGNVVWIGSDDGMTPDGDYDCDSFEMTVVLEIDSGGDNAGVMFRTGECPETNNAGPTYYVGLDPGSDEVTFSAMDDGSTEHYSASISGSGICYGKTYKLTISGSGDTYSVYLDGDVVLEDVTATDFSSGSIGLRTYKAPATYHYLSFECGSTKEPTAPTANPTEQPTTPNPTAEPTVADVFTESDSCMTFDDAQDYCEALGMELASIHSDAENEAANEECSTSCWIGLHCQNNDQFDFEWVNGKEWDYENWYSTQPDNWRDTDEDCAYMKSSGYWYDEECDETKRALCRVSDATSEPSMNPSEDPTERPTPGPTKWPTPSPSDNPTAEPSPGPTKWPTPAPSDDPTPSPTERPTSNPTEDPTEKPSKWPTPAPTDRPTDSPSANPTEDPTASPTTPSPTHPGELVCGDEVTGDFSGETVNVEVRAPYDCTMTVDLCDSDFEIGTITAFDSNGNALTDTDSTSCSLTVTDLSHGGDYFFYFDGADGVDSGTFDLQISCATDSPSRSPTDDPTERPTQSPSMEPSQSPSEEPSPNPTPGPTQNPSPGPTKWPTPAPSDDPTPSPTERPTSNPSAEPSDSPSAEPSEEPSAGPTVQPSEEPSASPSHEPSEEPSAEPTDSPTKKPTMWPTPTPSDHPSAEPSESPSNEPSPSPTKKPTMWPTPAPTEEPSPNPSPSPTKGPTHKPTMWPTPRPTVEPTDKPSMWPTPAPIVESTAEPSHEPTHSPSTAEPTMDPTSYPTFPVCDTDDALNIAFLMDESGSVDTDEWDIITEFVDRIATYDVAGASYVSLFEYASLPVYTQFLDWTPIETGRTTITNTLDRNPYTTTGKTFTWDAVNRVLDEFWSYRKNCTDGCETRHDILFLLTDGAPSDTVCPDMVERANSTTVDIVIIGIGTYAESTDNWMSQIDCLDIADDKEDIYYVTEFEAGDFNAIEGIIRNYTCNGENPASAGDRGGDPWVYDDGSTGLGPVPTGNPGGGVDDDTPSPVAAGVVVPDGGALTFSQWVSEGEHFFEIPAEISTTALVMMALAIFVAVTAFRWYRKKQKKSYKRVVFQDAASDSETDVEAAQPMNL